MISCKKQFTIHIPEGCTPDFTGTLLPCPGGGSPYSFHVQAVCLPFSLGFQYAINDGIHGDFFYSPAQQTNNEILNIYGRINADIAVVIKAQLLPLASKTFNVTIGHINLPLNLLADFGGGNTTTLVFNPTFAGGMGGWSGTIIDDSVFHNTWNLILQQPSSENSAQHGTLLFFFASTGTSLAESETKTGCRGNPVGVWSSWSGVALPFGATSINITALP